MHKVSSHFSYVNGRKIHYLKAGRGQPLVLLHASLCTAKTLTGIIEYLAKDYKVYAPDLPGYGKSDELQNSFSFEDMAYTVINWVLEEDIDNFVLAGISMGGTIAVHMAKYIDSRIKGYILIEPYLGKNTLLFPKKMIFQAELLITIFEKCIPTVLGNRIWSSEKALLFLSNTLSPVRSEHRPREQRLQILQSARYKTFWHILELLFQTNLDTKRPVSYKPALLIMSSLDKSLGYQITIEGFKQLFPHIKNVPIELAEHYPTQPITYRYMESHYPTLLGKIDHYFVHLRGK